MKYIKVLSLVFLIFVLISTVGYIYKSLKDDFIYKTSKTINVNLKTIIVNSVLDKYTHLLVKAPSYIGADAYYMNMFIKFRAEFLQVLRDLDNIRVVLYNTDGKVIFDTKQNEILDNKDFLLSSEEVSRLSKGEDLFYRIKNVASVSVFPIFPFNNLSEHPFVFLKIIRNNYSLANFFIDVYTMLIIVIMIIVIIFMFATYYIYSKNTKILSRQYDANLKLQAAKEMAEQENISKSKFLANVSHELRTPLNSIIGFSELIQNETMGSIENSSYREYINDIHSAGVHLLSLINDILDFSKAEADKLTVESIKFDLSKIVDSCFRMILPKAEKAKIKLEKHFPEEQVILKADPKRMKQVIINILSNSVKFTPENGVIKLTVRYDVKNNKIIIEMSDNGIGIAQQDLYKVMSVFGQADSEHSRKFEGTGLGLPLSKKLVELMNGTFHIKSEVNLGTVVTLTFPYVKMAEEKLF